MRVTTNFYVDHLGKDLELSSIVAMQYRWIYNNLPMLWIDQRFMHKGGLTI